MTLLEVVRACVAPDFEFPDSAHDVQHLDRVAALSVRLAEAEGADVPTVAVGAYLHDYHRVAEFRAGLRPVPAEQVMALVDECLVRVAGVVGGLDRERVRECVWHASRYSFAAGGLPVASLEARVVRDADNVDALGAVGVARAFSFGALLGEPFFSPEVRGGGYRSGRSSSVVSHFGEKLVRLRDDMETAAGRAVASERHRVMVGFLLELHAEAGVVVPGWLAAAAEECAGDAVVV